MSESEVGRGRVNVKDDSDPVLVTDNRAALSGKDFAVVSTMGTIGAVSILLCVFGAKGLLEKLWIMDTWDVVSILAMFLIVSVTLTYLFVYFTAQYFVYLTIRVIAGCIFPFSPSRARNVADHLITHESAGAAATGTAAPTSSHSNKNKDD